MITWSKQAGVTIKSHNYQLQIVYYAGPFLDCTQLTEFYVLLTVHPGMIPVNNQLDAQFFMNVYFYTLHVLGSHVPIIRKIIV